ncbi:hypothetical protein PsorP6_008928 [Peronosclerospora sorghi]|uniref:Uncharacterized protein n=1 Tax=Peronosclerospora sorghi TaxID=230839 RepID=A0ACC0VZZ4_9STRA|nr:hypothetical protein PsorP6_008928 [Peronosclerospora sorghi]
MENAEAPACSVSNSPQRHGPNNDNNQAVNVHPEHDIFGGITCHLTLFDLVNRLEPEYSNDVYAATALDAECDGEPLRLLKNDAYFTIASFQSASLSLRTHQL